MRYVFPERDHSIFFPRHNWKIFPGLASLFSLAAQRPLFFVALSPRPLHCRLFRGFAPRHTTACPASGAPYASCPNFPEPQRGGFFWAASRPIFSRSLRGLFFSLLRAPDTPQFAPLRGLSALHPPIFSPAAPDFFPAAARPFFPRCKVLLARSVSHPWLIVDSINYQQSDI